MIIILHSTQTMLPQYRFFSAVAAIVIVLILTLVGIVVVVIAVRKGKITWPFTNKSK